MRAGIRSFLEACRTPEVQRIVLIDGPAVLGWVRWREVAERYGLGLMESVIRAAIDAGEIVALPVEPLAHLLMGARTRPRCRRARSRFHGHHPRHIERSVDGLLIAVPEPDQSS